MPRRAPSPCTYPGCPELVDHGRCPAHRADTDRQYHSTPEAKSRKRIYNSKRWRGVRRAVLRANPWCSTPDCGALAVHVDHLIPLGQWQGDPFDRSNLVGLCKPCHSRKTAGETLGRRV
jgi:5-methylcytosine-specific restriction enzyme A